MAEVLILWIIISILIVLLIVLSKYTIFPFLNIINIKKDPLLYVKDVSISVGDIELHGHLVFPKYILDSNNNPTQKLPLVLVNHGWGAGSIIMNHYASVITLGGPYVTLLYDLRGFGKSPGKKGLGPQEFDDVIKVIDYATTLDCIDSNRLGFIGHSMGGNIAVTRAYKDARLKAVIGISTPYDTRENFLTNNSLFCRFLRLSVKPKKISDADNESISPKYNLEPDNAALNKRLMVIHSKSDSLILFKEFLEIKKALNLPEDQVFVVNKGGHTLMGQYLLVLAAVLRFFHQHL